MPNNPLQETVIASAPRCVIVLDSTLPSGKAANAAAVLALTVGQRHPGLVGAPLVDAGGQVHPGLIPTGIAVLAASQDELGLLREKGIAAGCDIVAFPLEGQQTTDYQALIETLAALPVQQLRYLGLAVVGARKPVGKLVSKLSLLK